MSLSDVVDLLACPRCQQRFSLDGCTLRCPDGHTFDQARQGHVNLLGSAQPQHADTVDMVQARADFLATGAYVDIADAVAARLVGARRILDVGAGTGWYLARWLDSAPDAVGLAIDISTAAARRAAKAHPRMGAVVADTWAGLPVRDSSVDALTCLFAPRNPTDFSRVLAPGGVMVIVAPTAEHLSEARASLGLLDVEENKQTKLLRQFSGLLEPVGQAPVRRTMHLPPAHLRALVGMGPNAFHTDAARIDAQETMAVTASVVVSWFRKPVS